MRDKPENDQDSGTPSEHSPAEKTEEQKPQTPETKNPSADESPTDTLTYRVKDLLQPFDANEPQENSTPSAGEKIATPSEEELSEDKPSYRVKDLLQDLNSTPSANHSLTEPAKIPGASREKPVQLGLSIRREIDLQDFFRNLDFVKIARGVSRRFWIVLLCAFSTLLLFLPIARHLQGGITWSAKSVIIYTQPEQKQVDAQGSSFLLRPLSEETLVDMLLSPAIISEIEEFTGFAPLKENLSFDTQAKSEIVTLQVQGLPDEQMAISAANKLAEAVIQNNALYYQDMASKAYEMYKLQREAAELELKSALAEVEIFQRENQILELNTQWNNFFAAQAALLERLSISKVAHEGLTTRIKEYEERISTLPDEVIKESFEDNPLKSRISNVEAALLQARIQYAADNPKIQRQERELEELRRMLSSGSFDATRERTYSKNPLKSQMEGELLKLRIEEEVTRKQTADMEKELAELNTQFDNMPRQEKEYAALLEKRALLDAAYKTLKANETAARMTMETNLSDFKMLIPASGALQAEPSLIGKIIPMAGFVFGFFGGLAILLIIELLDGKVRTLQQLENAYSAPCLASIVEIPNLEDYDIYQLLLPSLREISDRLDVLLQGQQVKTFGFLSSLNGEGKSILSFNLARYYSSLNTNVLFVSFDTQPNPCLPVAENVGWPQSGIEDYLRGKAQLSEMVSTVNGVDVIRIQEMQADLMDLTKGSAMLRLWSLLRENYDLILTDIPAVLDHPIAGTVSTLQDQLIYVLASSISDRKLTDSGLEFLEDRGQTPCAMIFNRVSPYYLEDVRQQRIIRNLADYSSPLATLKNRLQKLTEAMPKRTGNYDSE